VTNSKSAPENDTEVRRQEIVRLLEESARVKTAIIQSQVNEIEKMGSFIVDTYHQGGKVVLFGNGGSVADARHIAGELVGKFLMERRALPALALHTNTSILTALANDYGYEMVFTRQVEALVNKEDTVIGISTSGNSPNVIEAIKAAKTKNARTIGLTGVKRGKLADVADLTVAVPSDSTPRIQETHITIGHIICELVERELAEAS
jgi:D-sedoheptulose 7-phosphate isomerase